MNRMRTLDAMALALFLPLLAVTVPPTLTLSREKIQRAKCTSSLKTLGAAWQAYLSEYQGYAPDYGGVEDFGWGRGPGWVDKLFRYVDAKPDGTGPPYPENASSRRTEVFRCATLPNAPDGRKYFCSYIMNSLIYLSSSPDNRANVLKAKNRYKLVVLYDRNKWTGVPTDADMTDEWGNAGGPDGYGAGGLWDCYTGGPDFSGPHEGGYNILFADWHVKWFGKWESKSMTRHPEY
jgi:prepilin-type processing-associated H-X9-DG protein